MTDRAEPAGVGGNVLLPRVSEEISWQTAGDLGILFPGWLAGWLAGWRVWFEVKQGRWHAQREGNFPLAPGDEWVLMVSAGDVVALVTMLERQVRLDLAVEFPAWEISQTGTGGWQAVYRGGPAPQSGHTVLRVIHHPTIAGLLAVVRELATREGW
jgi:hypothetical protein